MKIHKLSIRSLLIVFPIFFITSLSLGQTKSEELGIDDYVVNAIKQFNIGKWDKGKNILEDALKEHAKDSDIRMLLGKYYLHFKQYDKARYELIKALEIKPDNIDAKQILLNVEIESKRYSSAICYVNELLEVSPYVKDLWQKKINLYSLQGNQVEVKRLQKRLLQIYPESTDIQNDYLSSIESEALSNRKEGKIDQALELSLDLLKHNPTNVSYYLDVVNDYLKAGDTSNALVYTNRGLQKLGGNQLLLNKKIGILEEQKRYEELLSLLEEYKLTQQYDYYLLEAARSAKKRDPMNLYAKVLDKQPGNEEAFNYVFNGLIEKQQYEQALANLSRYSRLKGSSKQLLLKELLVYKLMGDKSKSDAMIKQLFLINQDDDGLRNEYQQVMLLDAKDNMKDERYFEAVQKWIELSKYSTSEMYSIAQNGLYNAYLNLGDYNNALNTLNELLLMFPNNRELLLKKSELYFKQYHYHLAVNAYEDVLKDNANLQHQRDLIGYEDLLVKVIKDLNDKYQYRDSYYFTQRWLAHDPYNITALKYAVNISNQLGYKEEHISHLNQGRDLYPDDVFFKVKLSELEVSNTEDYSNSFNAIILDLKSNPFHADLLNMLENVGEKYTLQLIKEKKNEIALEKVDLAIDYIPQSKVLKYTKGLVLEKMKQFDKAYYYQSFYEPSILEMNEFKHRLQDIEYKAQKNEIGVQYIRNQFEGTGPVSSVSEVQYQRLEANNTYLAKVAYTGREQGKGIQVYGQWTSLWNNKFSTSVNVAFADDFFPEMLIDASVFKDFNFLGGIELELGGGYRKFKQSAESTLDQKNMYNVVFGATKQSEVFRFNTKLNNFFINNEWLYNLSINTRYYLSSSKNYITALAGIGSSPDVELIDYKFYDGFSVLNTNVGLGFGSMLYKNVSVGVVGTWYNYKVEETTYKNLYNLYFSLNVAF